MYFLRAPVNAHGGSEEKQRAKIPIFDYYGVSALITVNALIGVKNSRRSDDTTLKEKNVVSEAFLTLENNSVFYTKRCVHNNVIGLVGQTVL